MVMHRRMAEFSVNDQTEEERIMKLGLKSAAILSSLVVSLGYATVAL